MKLIVPADFLGDVRDVNGTIYPVVKGIVDMPDALVHDGLWGYGFIVAPAVVVAPSKTTSVAD